MNKSTLADYHCSYKTFVACLIISLMILSPLAPLASAASSFSQSEPVKIGLALLTSVHTRETD
jgi:hypothetical protein